MRSSLYRHKFSVWNRNQWFCCCFPLDSEVLKPDNTHTAVLAKHFSFPAKHKARTSSKTEQFPTKSLFTWNETLAPSEHEACFNPKTSQKGIWSIQHILIVFCYSCLIEREHPEQPVRKFPGAEPKPYLASTLGQFWLQQCYYPFILDIWKELAA